MLVYGANTPFGSRTIVWRLNSFSSSSLIRAQTPSPKRVPFGTTMPHARPLHRPTGRREFPHDELQEQQRRLRGLLVFREVALRCRALLRRQRADSS